LLQSIKKELESLKLINIKAFDAEGKSILADYFFISTADSLVQIEAARNKLIELMDKHNIYLKNNLEEWHGGWCLLDFGNIIIHILLEERRSFYQIDRLMENAEFKLMNIDSEKLRKKTQRKKRIK